MDRTRFLPNDGLRYVSQVITLFCKKQDIFYKQGINEVLAPFIWLSGQTNEKGERRYSSGGKGQKPQRNSFSKTYTGTFKAKNSVSSISKGVTSKMADKAEEMNLEAAYLNLWAFINNF